MKKNCEFIGYLENYYPASQ